MEKSVVAARKRIMTRGIGVSSSSMPFHSCPVVSRPVTGSCLSVAMRLLPRPVVLVENALLGAVEALPVGRPEHVDQHPDREDDQVEKPPALGEGDERL